MQKDEWKDYFKDYNPPFADQTIKGFEACLKEAGFSKISVSYLDRHFVFYDKESMVRYFLQWLPQLARLKTEGLREEFTRELIDQYLTDGNYTELNIPLNFPSLIAEGIK